MVDAGAMENVFFSGVKVGCTKVVILMFMSCFFTRKKRGVFIIWGVVVVVMM